MGYQDAAVSTSQRLWQHPDPESTRMHEFKGLIEDKYDARFPDYESLRQWTIQYPNAFWEEVWYSTGVVASTPFSKVGRLSLDFQQC